MNDDTVPELAGQLSFMTPDQLPADVKPFQRRRSVPEWWRCAICDEPVPDDGREGWMAMRVPGRAPNLRCPECVG